MNTTRRYIDVRNPSEFASGHIEGSVLVPLNTLSKEAGNWDKREPLTLVCRSGQRAGKARAILSAMRFEDVDVLPGGVARWSSAGKPLIKSDGSKVRSSRLGWVIEGLVILGSLALAATVSAWFLIPAALVGIKLILGK